MDAVQRAEEIAASMEFKNALEEFLKPFDLHGAVVVWVKEGPEEQATHIGIGSFAVIGCPVCAARALAKGVAYLPKDMRDPFRTTMSEIVHSPGRETVIELSSNPGQVH